ncbi:MULTISPECIES: lysozyme inhibitor LprI family protein [unclassified Bacillus (in: firmicutes)]
MWDDALNEIYGVLKTQLSNNEMKALKEKQREH